jgi:hypothetical protein
MRERKYTCVVLNLITDVLNCTTSWYVQTSRKGIYKVVVRGMNWVDPSKLSLLIVPSTKRIFSIENVFLFEITVECMSKVKQDKKLAQIFLKEVN